MAIHTIAHACAACPPQAYDLMSLVKSFGWGFLAFPVVYYIIRVFGKQIWADLSALWTKLFAKAEAKVQTYVPLGSTTPVTLPPVA